MFESNVSSLIKYTHMYVYIYTQTHIHRYMCACVCGRGTVKRKKKEKFLCTNLLSNSAIVLIYKLGFITYHPCPIARLDP